MLRLCLHGKPGVQWWCMVAGMAIPLHSHLLTQQYEEKIVRRERPTFDIDAVSLATKSCTAHTGRAVVGHFAPSAEPRVPDRRQARTGARMWPAHKPWSAGSRNQSRAVCTPDAISLIPGSQVVLPSSMIMPFTSFGTRGLNKACSNFRNPQALVSCSSPGEALQAGDSSDGQASCYL